MAVKRNRISKIPSEVLDKFKDPRQFFKFLKVFDKQSNALVPFQLHDEQEALLDALLEHNRIVILKARQIGCSTLVRAYFLWKAFMSSEPTRHAIISYSRDSADHLHSIDKEFYLSLPKPLQRKLSKSSARTLRLGDTGAELRSFTASGKAGATRSFAFSSAHLSEFAFFPDQSDLLANVMASAGEGQIIIETTPNNVGDLYHEIILGSPGNGWHLCFFPWYEHSTYTKKSQFHQPQIPDMSAEEIKLMKDHNLTKGQMWWRRSQISSMGIEKFRREFPATIDEAFFSTSNNFFPIDILDNQQVVDNGSRELRQPHQYIPGDKYCMGVDVAHGGGGDYSVITLVSCTTLQPCFHYRSNTILPHDLADKIYDLYFEWGQPYTIIEANGPGHVVIDRLAEWGVKNLYKNKHNKPWLTNKHNKIQILDYLRDLLCDDVFEALDKTLWSEMRNMQITKGAPAVIGGNDDMVIATALALWGTKLKPVPSFTDVRRSLVDDFIKKQRGKKIIRERNPINKIRTWSNR